MTLRQRYEKRLWSLILENEGTAPEANAASLKEKLEKIAKKIEKSGLSSTMSGTLSEIGKLISSMKDLTDPESTATKENDILRDVKAELTNKEKSFYKKYEDICVMLQQRGTPNFYDINLHHLGLVSLDDGKWVYREYVNKSLEMVEKIKKSFIDEAKNWTQHRNNLEELEKEFDGIMKPWIDYLESSSSSPTPDIVVEVIDTFEKKINAIIKAYGEWLGANKDTIKGIMEALSEESGGSAAKPQTSGYRRLGNTLFERFIMSRGLK